MTNQLLLRSRYETFFSRRASQTEELKEYQVTTLREMLDHYIRKGNLLHPFIVHTKLLPETKSIIREELAEEGFCCYIKELDISTEITLA